MGPKSRNIQEAIIGVARRKPGGSVEEVVTEASKVSGAPSFLVARSLHTLREEEKLTLEDLTPPVSIGEYLQSHYALWFWATFATVILTLVSVFVLPQGVPFIYLRNIAGGLFVLYLPGYSVVEALYPQRRDLEGLERLALSIGLSLALVPLVGLGLNYTPWGIRLNPLLTALTLLTLGLSVGAVWRKVGYMRVNTIHASQLPRH